MTQVRGNTVSPVWLALLAGPLSFGITGPALVLTEVASEVGVSLAQAAALVTAFGWGIAVGTPLMGVLLARRGVRAALVSCAVLVTAGALLVLTVPGLLALVLGCGLQALGAAGFTVVAMSLAGTPTAMGLVTASLASVGAVAPLIGAQLAAALSWRVALVLPLLSLLALPATLRGTPSSGQWSRPERGDRLDAVGAVLAVVLVTALVFVPHRPLVAGPAVVVAAALLAWHARRRVDGFVPASVLASPVFALASLLAFSLAVVNFGVLYAVPGLLTALTGWTSGQLGVALLVPYLIGGAGSWPLVAASARLRFAVLVAVLLAGGLVALASAVLGGALPVLFAAMVIGALSAATGQGALALRAAASVPEAVRPSAIGLFNLCFLLGAAFGPAIAAASG